MWTYRGIRVHWLGHDSFLLQGSKTVILDPYKTRGDYKADILLISHEHYDHLSDNDIKRFITPHTVIVAAKMCEVPLKKYSNEKRFIHPGSETEVEGVRIEAVPAYNINKFREPGKVFHPKADEKNGYVVTLDGVRFYHAGDSDATPEMKAIDVDVAFLPVSGIYVMTPEEAAEAAKAMKAKVVVPMHIEAGIGTMADAERFKIIGSKLCAGQNKEFRILEKE